MISSKCGICDSKKSRFVKKQELSGILTNSGLKTRLSKVPIIRWCFALNGSCIEDYKMNEIIIKFLLARDKIMPKIHLKQPEFNYSACWPFTKNKEKIQKFKETGYSRYIYRNELDKTYFQHDIA